MTIFPRSYSAAVGLLWLFSSLEGGATAARLDSFKVMTRNLYFGADINPALDAIAAGQPLEVILGLVAAAIGQGLTSGFEARMAAVADEIADSEDVMLVGLQEAFKWSIDGVVVADAVELLISSLADKGLIYEAVASNFVWEFSAPNEGNVYKVEYSDIILAKVTQTNDLHISNSQSGTYDVQFTVTGSPVGDLLAYRGWASVDANIPGCKKFRFVTTHLESITELVRVPQALELINELDIPTAKDPIVLVGDFNADANVAADAPDLILQNGFTDAWDVAGSTDGLTFGHDPNLADPSVEFDKRIDFITVAPTHNSDVVVLDAFTVDEDIAGTRPLWPSDHRGVVAEIACKQNE